MKNEWLTAILGEGVEITAEQDNAIARHLSKTFVSKSDFNEKLEKLKEAQETLDANKAQMEELQKASSSAQELQEKFAAVQAQQAQAAEELANKDRESQIMRAILKAGAYNENAVRAMLDMSKIQETDKGLTGLNEQLQDLQKSEAWAFSGGQASSRLPMGNVPGGEPLEDVNSFMNETIRGNLTTGE